MSSFSRSAFDFGSIAISISGSGWMSSTIAQSQILMVRKLFPINILRIKQPFGAHKPQLRAALAGGYGAVEARAAAGVAGSTGLFDPDPDRVLIAIDPHLDHALDMAGAFAFSPQRMAGAAEVPGFPAGDGLAQGFIVHMRDHQHLAGAGVGRHAGHEPRRVEPGLEPKPFLDVIDRNVTDGCGYGHDQSLVISSEGWLARRPSHHGQETRLLRRI